jgi:hypothetical protein
MSKLLLLEWNSIPMIQMVRKSIRQGDRPTHVPLERHKTR